MKKAFVIYLSLILLTCIINLLGCNNSANNPDTSNTVDSSTNNNMHDTSDMVTASKPGGSDTYSSDTSKGIQNSDSTVATSPPPLIPIKIDRDPVTKTVVPILQSLTGGPVMIRLNNVRAFLGIPSFVT